MDENFILKKWQNYAEIFLNFFDLFKKLFPKKYLIYETFTQFHN